MERRGPQAIIANDKSNFILFTWLKEQPYIMTNFQNINGIAQPSLVLGTNRLHRAQLFLKLLPSVFSMMSDGKLLYMDVVNKLIQFQEPNISGIITYHLTDLDSLQFKVDSLFEKQPIPEDLFLVVESSDETKMKPDTLKLFSSVFYKGGFLCLMNKIEKTLHTSLLDPTTGYLGSADPEQYKNVLITQQVWPELGLNFKIAGDELSVFSEQLKGKFNEPGFLYLHRNFGLPEIKISKTHGFLR